MKREIDLVPIGEEKYSRSENIYYEIRKKILTGVYTPGERLLVLEIAQEFGVSQAPVREAFERLKQEELLIGVKNKGSMVSKIDQKEIEDIYILRDLLEKYVIKKYLQNKSEEDIAYLETIYKKMEAAAVEEDLVSMIDFDMMFHQLFYEKCGNTQILQVWKNIKVKVTRFTVTTNRLYFPNLKTIADTHLVLINILKNGTEEEILGVFEDHMNEVWWRMRDKTD